MEKKITQLIEETKKRHPLFQPLFYRLTNNNDKQAFNELIEQTPTLKVFDELTSQLEELIKLRSPQIKYKQEALEKEIQLHLGTIQIEDYGVWVFYPWSLTLIHLLDEEEFIEVRTNRNKYKITEQEAAILSTKKIGVIGLSVGRSIAMTMATERIVGEIRLADFDVLELSNYNRIQASLIDMGVSKVISAARQIAEIDPFLKVICYHDGITEENITDFFLQGGKLDIVLDECDGLDMKIFARKKAKELSIPVVMDTSDRGMIDVERFDLEPNRPILHGLIDHLDTNNLKELTNEEKIPYILPMVGIETISPRLKASMIEVEQTITTWPQLASSVMLGGAVAIDVCRRIVLNQFNDSGRYYVDVEELVNNENRDLKKKVKILKKEKSLLPGQMRKDAMTIPSSTKYCQGLNEQELKTLIQAATLAPSGGNCQPWKWLYTDKKLLLFHNKVHSTSFLDYNSLASYIAFGAASENLILKAHQLGLEVVSQFLPIKKNDDLIATFNFFKSRKKLKGVDYEQHDFDYLVDAINVRNTNRKVTIKQQINQSILDHLKEVARTIQGARLLLFDRQQDIDALSEIIGEIERMRLLHNESYRDIMNEIRWTKKEAIQSNDGIDLRTVDLTAEEAAGLAMLKNPLVTEHLNRLGEEVGAAFKKQSKRAISAASAIGLIVMPSDKPEAFYNGGRALQRVWLEANNMGVSLQPLSPLVFYFARLLANDYGGLSYKQVETLNRLKIDFEKIKNTDLKEIFLFRLCIADAPTVKSLRRPINKILIS